MACFFSVFMTYLSIKVSIEEIKNDNKVSEWATLLQ